MDLVVLNLSSALMWVVAPRKVRLVVGKAQARARAQERALAGLLREEKGAEGLDPAAGEGAWPETCWHPDFRAATGLQWAGGERG